MKPPMDDVTLAYAKEHLEELIERARRGEDVRITDGKGAVTISSSIRREANYGYDAAVRPP